MVTVDRRDDRAFLTDQLPEDRLIEGYDTQRGEVFGRRVMVLAIEHAAVIEMRIRQAEGRGLRINESHELCFVATHMLHRCKTGIVRGHDQHGLQQIFQPKNLPCLHA